MAMNIVEMANTISEAHGYLVEKSSATDSANALFQALCRDQYPWDQTVGDESALYTVCLSLMTAFRGDDSATDDTKGRQMTKVFLHTYKPDSEAWPESLKNEAREFSRLPIEGEYLARDFNSPWYRVELVVHCPFEAEFEAEVHAVEVDHMEEQHKKISPFPLPR